jgi:hypothetical protein
MSVRSFTRSALLALVACKQPREADPAQVKALAERLIANAPAPAAVRDCAARDFRAAATLTQRTLLGLAGRPLGKDHELDEFANPPELDAPTARVLVDPAADETDRRRAAAVLLDADAYVVYRVDTVNAPLAIGVKDPKIGTIGARAIRYARDGRPECMLVFFVQNDKQRAAWAIQHAGDRPFVEPAVARAMRDDLTAQYLARIARIAAGSAS